MTDPKAQLLDAALMHVPFDGWSPATFKAAIADSGVDPTVAQAVCPRGAVDLAVAFHKRGDHLMLEALKAENLGEMRFRDRIARGAPAAGTGHGQGSGAQGHHVVCPAALCARWGQADLGHLRSDLEYAGRHIYRLQLVHQAGDPERGLFRDCDFLAGRYQRGQRGHMGLP